MVEGDAEVSDEGRMPPPNGNSDVAAELAEARRRLAELEAENRELRGRLGDQQFAETLRSALSVAGAAATIAAPVSHGRLLEMIVETAAHVIKANAASLFLIDHKEQVLVFEVALGEKADEVRKFKVPLGKGFAGLVAVTGQPMSISKVSEDPRWNSEIGTQVGYRPETMLNMPLRYGDEVIGVIQLLDKEGGQPFSPADMETLGLFAEQAAVAIEQSRITRNLAAIFVSVLQSLADGSTDTAEVLRRLTSEADDFMERIEESASYRDALDLARQVQRIAGEGPAERQLAMDVLNSVGAYLRSRPQLDFSMTF